jgi:hypothetical protein
MEKDQYIFFVRNFINTNEKLLYQAIQNWSWINQRVLGSHLKLGQTPGEVFFSPN